MKRRMLIAGLLLVVSACSSREITPPGVLGDWELQRGTSGANPFPLVEGHRVTIGFAEDGTVGGVAACNSYGGTYVADGEDIIVGEELASTAMGCAQPVMDSEAAFLAALREPLTYVVDGDEMTIGYSAGKLVFTRVQPVPTAALLDTRWLLDSLIVGDTVTSAQGEATLLIGSDGTVSGSTGCRTFSGSHVIDADTVLFTTFAMAGDCPAELANQDGLIVDVLGDGFTPVIEGDRLTLSSRGSEGLVYRSEG
jgi:heat shock protein HslJ